MTQNSYQDNFPIVQINEIDTLHRRIHKNFRIVIDLSNTKYELIREVVKIFEWQISEQKSDNWVIKWQDHYIIEQDIRKLTQNQKINHFPGSFCLCQKKYLAKNLNKLQKMFPLEYDFFPQTWILPSQLQDFKNYYYNKEIKKIDKVFISKPEALAQGKGIFIFLSIDELNYTQNSIIQQYISNPYLIDGLKFDIRLYVLIKSLNPLKIFLFKDGICRFSTEKYQKPNKYNIDDIYMHLTNYAINKQSHFFKQNYVENDKEQGHKRSFFSVLQDIRQNNGDVEELMKQIRDLIVKTVCSVYPVLSQNYKCNRPKEETQEVCFELLGFDLMIDQNFKPYLIEINHTPSFQTDSNLDYLIKKNVILDTLILLNVQTLDNEKIQQNSKKLNKNQREEAVIEYENQNLYGTNICIKGFMRCYPVSDQNYNDIIKNINSQAMKLWISYHGPRQNLSYNSQDINIKEIKQQKKKSEQKVSKLPPVKLKKTMKTQNFQTQNILFDDDDDLSKKKNLTKDKILTQNELNIPFDNSQLNNFNKQTQIKMINLQININKYQQNQQNQQNSYLNNIMQQINIMPKDYQDSNSQNLEQTIDSLKSEYYQDSKQSHQIILLQKQGKLNQQQKKQKSIQAFLENQQKFQEKQFLYKEKQKKLQEKLLLQKSQYYLEQHKYQESLFFPQMVIDQSFDKDKKQTKYYNKKLEKIDFGIQGNKIKQIMNTQKNRSEIFNKNLFKDE